MSDIKKEEPKEIKLTKEELTALIQVVNQPRTQDLQVAGFFINLNNKLAKMVDELK